MPSTSPSPSPPPPPPIWAHLYVLDKWAQFTRRGKMPTTLKHEPLALQDPDWHRPQSNNRLRQAADGITLFCATPNSTTACTLEFSAADAEYTIRIARDEGFRPEQLAGIRKLLGCAEKAVAEVDWNVDSRVARGKMFNVTDSFLVDVADHCYANIAALAHRFEGARCSLKAWILDRTPAVLTRIPVERRADVFADLQLASRPIPLSLEPDVMRDVLVAVAGLVPVFQKYDLYDPLRDADSSSSQEDDDFPLIPTAVFRYIDELGRYFVAALNIVGCFASLSRKIPVAAIFRVEALTPPPRASPGEEMEPKNLDSYLTTQLDMLSKCQVAERLGVGQHEWATARDEHTLSYHAEVQLAAFYALNPDTSPIGDYIGVSRASCGLCDFVLRFALCALREFKTDLLDCRALHKSPLVDARYTLEATGLSVQLSVAETDGRMHPNWRFPDIRDFITTSNTFLPLAEQARVHRRFGLVRVELAEYLRGLVKDTLPQTKTDVPRRKYEVVEDDMISIF
ncbi:hypothetical protein C8R46DRAFT_1188033 [Mycena filopes]|nr:hypothetical protein C8R46DRAFT_1188033 [Mycena filopes]